MTSSEGETIGEILLKKRIDTSVRFDTIASSLIAGLMMATLPGGLAGTILLICAVILALTGIVRWLGVTGRFADEETVLRRTYRPLELLTIIGVFHLINISVDRTVLEILPQFSLPVLTSVGAVIVTLLGIVAIEFIQWNYRLWWGTVFFVKASATKQQEEDADEPFKTLYNALTNLWAMIAYFLLKDSIPDGDEPELNDLREFVEDVNGRLGNSKVSSGIARIMLILAIVMIPSFAVIAWILSWILGPATEIFAVLIGVWTLQHVVSFYYTTNGTLTIETWLQSNKMAVLTRIGYTGIIYWIFFMTQLYSQ